MTAQHNRSSTAQVVTVCLLSLLFTAATNASNFSVLSCTQVPAEHLSVVAATAYLALPEVHNVHSTLVFLEHSPELDEIILFRYRLESAFTRTQECVPIASRARRLHLTILDRRPDKEHDARLVVLMYPVLECELLHWI